MACRVCLALGIDDPEQWLAEASPRKLALWEAYWQLEPFGCDWERSATQSFVISQLLAMTAAASGVKRWKHHEFQDFMPRQWDGRKRSRKAIKSNIAAFQAWATKYERKPNADNRRT